MYFLEVVDSKKRTTKFNLMQPTSECKMNVDAIYEHGFVYADEKYKLYLKGNEHPIERVSFYINGEKINSLYSEGLLYLTRNYEKIDALFEDSYGYVQLSCSIDFLDGFPSVVLISELIPIAVKNDERNIAVQKMLEYVYDNDRDLLSGRENFVTSIDNLSEGGYATLDARIALAENIVNIYEENFGFFKANSRTQPIQVEVVDRIEKMQYASFSTVNYISTHPEYLRQSKTTNCINIGNTSVYPVKTLTSQILLTKDVYENRVMVSFLETMIFNMNELRKTVDEIIDSLPKTEFVDDEYVFSSYVLAASFRLKVEEYINRLNQVRRRAEELFCNYSLLLQTTHVDVVSTPKPTHVLISVPQYNRVYSAIYKWFNYGKYDFYNERFMMSFFKASDLFEYYSLSRIINGLKLKGYNLDKSEKYSYLNSNHWMYKNTSCNNTFYFSNGHDEIVLYYQPVIFDFDSRKYNGIGLYRNTSISLGGQVGNYYSPDMIIKRIVDGLEYYLIVDSKYSSLSSVKKNEVVDLAYKYIVSISPSDENSLVVGLCMTYGKCNEKNTIESVYNKQNPEYVITPFYELVPISENIAEKINQENISQMLNILMYEYS